VILDNGEKGKGRWVPAQSTAPSTGSSDAKGPADSGLASDWDTIYGPGFYVSHVVGSKFFVRAEVTGNRGTVLHMEMYQTPEGETLDIRGVAQDNNGNLYKVVF
jgi:hypothetical protein